MIVDADIVEEQEALSVYAVASFVLSLFGVLTCGVAAVFGVIFGLIALRKKNGPLSVASKIFSIIGLSLGLVMIFFMLTMLIFACVFHSVGSMEYRTSQYMSCSTACSECYSQFMSFHESLRDSVMEMEEKIYPASTSEVFDQVSDSYMGGVWISCSDSDCAGYVYYYLPEVYSFVVDFNGPEPLLIGHAPGEDAYQVAYADGNSMTFFDMKSLWHAFIAARHACKPLSTNRHSMRWAGREHIEQSLMRMEKDVYR